MNRGEGCSVVDFPCRIVAEILMFHCPMHTGESGTVGRYISVETPFLAQDVGQQHLVGTAGQSAVRLAGSLIVGIKLCGVNGEGVVGSHETLYASLPDAHLECRQIILAHVLFRDERGGRLSSLLVVVGCEVLGACH